MQWCNKKVVESDFLPVRFKIFLFGSVIGTLEKIEIKKSLRYVTTYIYIL